jgi:hypothetical protein
MPDYFQEEVPDWFARSSLARIMERRTHGITADFVLGELVRRPGDDGRTKAASMTRPEGQPDERAPGEGEWHGAVHHIQATDDRRDPAYIGHYRRRAERAWEFQQALEEADVCPACVYSAALEAAIDDQVGFFDRRYSGRRYRPQDNYGILDGPQEPYPHPGLVDEARYRSW